jgi:Ca-activated chloride channel family protein
MKRINLLQWTALVLIPLFLFAGCQHTETDEKEHLPIRVSTQVDRVIKKEHRAPNTSARPAYAHKKALRRSHEIRPVRFNTEQYDQVTENGFRRVDKEPLSTFSIDVDTASYSNIRRFITQGSLPLKDAVRVEEMLNYFNYAYKGPAGSEPFHVTTEVNESPWNIKHRLVRIGIKGKTISNDKRPASNLVFLLDVSGSMGMASKLPLLKKAFKVLVNNLGENDKVSIVVYAGASGLVLQPTSGDRKGDIIAALNRLQAGGTTHGASGIDLAYKVAKENFIAGGINRVILATDGDMNVGVTHRGGLVGMVKERAKTGVFLTVLGFGTGNLKDSQMEQIANQGNGNYAYIDSVREARKVLGTQMGGTLITIAKDVKLQVEFNPAKVAGYRLIGYENRLLANSDFNNDKKDAGELGAGHTVTALYEVIPAGLPVPVGKVDALKYQTPSKPAVAANSNELMTLKLRYKAPQGSTSELISTPITDLEKNLSDATSDFRFASAVASFGMLLRGSRWKGEMTWSKAIALARSGMGADTSGHRKEMVSLMEKARAIVHKNDQ